MSGIGGLLAGLGMGAAQAYVKNKAENKENAFQAKRDEALASGGKIPVPKRVKVVRPIDTIMGKIKNTFSNNQPTLTPTIPKAPSMVPIAAVSTPPIAEPDEYADAFDDDETVPNKPVPFKNSYA